jgi:hypothetical protein
VCCVAAKVKNAFTSANWSHAHRESRAGTGVYKWGIWVSLVESGK